MPTATTQRARREAARRIDPQRRSHGEVRITGAADHRRTHDSSQQLTRRSHELNGNGALDPASLSMVWDNYKKQPHATLREQLVVHYMGGHVKRIAERMRSSLPIHIEVEDLMQQGFLGLVESIERFEPERGYKFETFSSRRISGSMQDWLRQQDHLPRLMRTRSRKIGAATEQFKVMHGRTPSPTELQSLLGFDDEAFQQCFNDRIAPMVVTFTTMQSNDHDSSGGMNLLEEDGQHTPLKELQEQDLKRWVTRKLDSRDRLIILLYYYEAMTMREIGQALGCSESRISQRLDSILQRLRSRLDEQAVIEEFMG